jgi:phosphoserine phosphatase RsbX
MRDQASNLSFGSHARPYAGLTVCGDASVVLRGNGTVLAALIDGLGHGLDAAVAADRAIEVIAAHRGCDTAAVMWACHHALRSTRGAAVALLAIAEDGVGEFCGVGNIEVLAASGNRPQVFSVAGIVGHNFRKASPMRFRMNPGDIYCLVTDGVSSRAEVATCPPLDPCAMARQVVERWGRFSDDASALVVAFRAELATSPKAPAVPTQLP